MNSTNLTKPSLPSGFAKALPHVDINRQSINWPKIWANDFGGGHSAALVWAQAIWCDQVETKGDPFDRLLLWTRRFNIQFFRR